MPNDSNSKNSKDKVKFKNSKQINALDTLSRKLLLTIDPSLSDQTILSETDARVQRILADELNFSKGVANGNILDFIAGLSPTTGQKSAKSNDVDFTEMFTKDVGEIYTYFQDLYQNRYLEMADLRFVAKFIPALGEAVKATLDAITSADDMSASISRNLTFSSNMTDDEQATVINELERIEKDEKLLKRLKNIVFQKALITGSHYVYHIPYTDLFQEYEKRSRKRKNSTPNNKADPAILKNRQSEAGINVSRAKESNSIYTDDVDGSIDIALESDIKGAIDGMTYLSSDERNSIKKNFSNINWPSFTILEDTYLDEAVEGIRDLQELDNRSNTFRYSNNALSTGVATPDSEVTGSKNKSTYRIGNYKVSGTYIKYIDSKNLIPIRIYDQIVGYYLIHSEKTLKNMRERTHESTVANTVTSLGSSLFTMSNLTDRKKERAIQDIADAISSRIIKNFSPKFITKYTEHKKLIADCLIANGIVDNDYKIQFIPAQYITPFVINEDEHGNGESILAGSLFAAKLLLSLTVSKLLNYMNNSGNKTIAYVSKGPIGVNGANHVQRVMRMLQESQITFNDLLSTQQTFSKFTRDTRLSIPKARNGDKLVEFEVQEGQRVDLKTDFEDWLEKMAIMGTGVPSTILEYTDAADYAKSIVSANIKFASRISSLQSDLEDSCTNLYKTLILGSALDDQLKTKAINSFTFKLPRPKVVQNANIADYVQTLMQTGESIATLHMAGKTYEYKGNDMTDQIKAHMQRNYVYQNAPFLDQDEMKALLEQSILEVISDIKFDESGGGSEPSDGGGDDNTEF